MNKFANLVNSMLHPLGVKIAKSNPTIGKGGQKIFFMHLPKCAGTATYFAVRNALGVNGNGVVDANKAIRIAQAIHDTDDLEILLPRIHEARIGIALRHFEEGVPFITGHIPYCKAAFAPYKANYRFITTIRDPLKRVISSYKYGKGRGLNYAPSHKKHSFQEELDFFLDSARGKFETNQYAAFFGGFHTTQTYEDNLELAKANVADFDLIGFTDNIPQFEKDFESKFGLQLEVNAHRKTSHFLKDRFTEKEVEELNTLFTKEVRERITEMCQMDYEIYNHARQLFG